MSNPKPEAPGNGLPPFYQWLSLADSFGTWSDSYGRFSRFGEAAFLLPFETKDRLRSQMNNLSKRNKLAIGR